MNEIQENVLSITSGGSFPPVLNWGKSLPRVVGEMGFAIYLGLQHVNSHCF